MKKLGLMTVAEAAEYLNVPRPTLYQHLREGHIPGIQIGGRWRIEQDKLNDFIGNAKRGGSTTAGRSVIMEDVDSAATFGAVASRRMESNVTSDRLQALREENGRLRELVADQLLELERLKGARR